MNLENFPLSVRDTGLSSELAAVGRVAKLGQLYDARSDTFLHSISLFNSNLPEGSVTSTDKRETKMQYAFSNSMEEKFKTMDISGELKLSILAGIIQLEGSGEYFKDTKHSEKTAKVSLVISIATKYEEISLTSSDVKSIIDYTALEKMEATHVVGGIQWGGNIFISVEVTNSDEKHIENIEGSLMIDLQKMTKFVSGSAEGQLSIDEKELKELNKYQFKIFGDILQEEVPQTLTDALKFIKDCPRSLKVANNGKGKAVKYSLTPLSQVRTLMNSTKITDLTICHLNDTVIKTCVKLFDEFNAFERKLNDLVDEVTKYQNYIHFRKVKELKDLQHEFQTYQVLIQSDLAKNMKSVRSGDMELKVFEDIIQKAIKNPYSWHNSQMKVLELIRHDVSFIKLMTKLNVIILVNDEPLQIFLQENYNKDIYMLFYNSEFIKGGDKHLKSFREIHSNKEMYGQNALFVVSRCESFGELPEVSSNVSRLCLYREGECINDNFEPISEVPDKSKPELWSYHYIKEELAKIVNNPVPIGFIYVQLHGQPVPEQMWPHIEWSDVTSEYAGLFFRAEGGDSGKFGDVQIDQTRRVTCMYSSVKDNTVEPGQIVSLTPGQWSSKLFTGYSKLFNPTNYKCDSIEFKVNDDEVRPRNCAMRIWKRIK